MFSFCNVINKREVVEDFIQVNPKFIGKCIKMLIPSKNDNKYRSRCDNLKFSCQRLHVAFNV